MFLVIRMASPEAGMPSEMVINTEVIAWFSPAKTTTGIKTRLFLMSGQNILINNDYNEMLGLLASNKESSDPGFTPADEELLKRRQNEAVQQRAVGDDGRSGVIQFPPRG